MRRVIDSALWGSHKLKKVPREYQAEYANLLPLADANGVFLYDVETIQHKVFGFNRPHITPRMVADMLRCFEVAGMLVRFASEEDYDNNRIYGYFVGMEKPGRLPDRKKVKASLPDHDSTVDLHIDTLPIYKK